MGQENHSVLLEDNRFKTIKRLKKKDLPHQLYWYLKQDYFSEELLGLYWEEVDTFNKTATVAFELFQSATQKVINDQKLGDFGIPKFFWDCIHYTWEHRKEHPFLYGRFDVNGGFGNTAAKVIEFNADTCSTLPETILWQKAQLNLLTGASQFNTLAEDIGHTLAYLKTKIPHDQPFILGSSFGYEEDVLNVNAILDIGYEQGYKVFYTHLEDVIFSHENGILYEINGEYQIADIWFKMIPWDWMFTDEPELAKDLATIIQKDLCTVLNPPITALWQNKKFLAYLTENYPNDCIANTYLTPARLSNYVAKPIFGRLGENIEIHTSKKTTSKGDYAHQEKIHQEYIPLAKDSQKYAYQTGVFYTHKASAINLRTEDNTIITDDCEFMTHYII
ncbi:glutathionylspermidine synthase family protein [Flavobacterium sp. ASW18X]|uniref:glutathionylspermidine synthase family protein n=1 Tax=Flavobacterium sp. ASW18X TaxID=2572595 RepID=UPI0010AEAFBD|nr:glutathionylspermidine synthase family protein [Flavobacterium sp. ASW18X]TKD63450.1 glutathionylspermidine synthase family protein [Flavobacterium sp. ASW18X]